MLTIQNKSWPKKKIVSQNVIFKRKKTSLFKTEPILPAAMTFQLRQKAPASKNTTNLPCLYNKGSDSINSPFRGLGIFGSGWHRQNCKPSLFTDLVGLELPDDEALRSLARSLVETIGPSFACCCTGDIAGSFFIEPLARPYEAKCWCVWATPLGRISEPEVYLAFWETGDIPPGPGRCGKAM